MISVVIPNYNGKHILQTCLQKNVHLFNHVGITDIIISDDCSSDDSVAYIRQHFPNITVIKNTQNNGFGSNCNIGATAAKEPILFLLNNDMVVQDLQINAIKQALENPAVFAYSPTILRKKEGILINETPNIGFFKGGWLSCENYEGLQQNNPPTEGLSLFWACGGAMFVTKENFFKFNGFSPVMDPFYFEDADLSYRAQKKGLKVLYTLKATCYHMHQATIASLFTQQQIHAIHLRNHYRFMWKNLTDPTYIMAHFFTVLLKIITLQITDIKAIIQASKALPAIFKSRQQNGQSLVSDATILSQWKR